jgi:hypothetical protein
VRVASVIVLILLVVGAVLLTRFALRLRRDAIRTLKPGSKCPTCGYLREGLPTEQCPECGLTYAEADDRDGGRGLSPLLGVMLALPGVGAILLMVWIVTTIGPLR